MKKKKVLSVLLATAVAGSMVSVTAGCNVENELKPTTVFFAGDSTVCAFNDSDYIPRYGYGTQFANYVSDKVTVRNLAFSGTSSYSYTQTYEYDMLKKDIKAGDYLIISFGHNDEVKNENDSPATLEKRYTNPNLEWNDETLAWGRPVSFKYNLYKNYIEMAQERGAIPILCTPIVRLSEKNDYALDKTTGCNEKVHNTKDFTIDGVKYAGGDYVQAIIDLGKTIGVTCINMTEITLADYNFYGYAEVKNRHAVKGAEYADSTGNELILKEIDNTHTNKFGASINAYYLANELKKKGNSLGKYVKSDIPKPEFKLDGVVNSNYMFSRPGQLKASEIWKVSEPWYGTAYGVTGTKKFEESFVVEQNPSDAGENVFKVGGLATDKGKISKNEEGFAAAFRQIGKNTSFEITAEVTLDSYSGNEQTGFGIMIRDNIAIDAQLGKEDSIKSDYVAAGAYLSAEKTNIIFSRSGKTSGEDTEYGLSSPYQVSKINDGELVQGSTHTLKLYGLGDTITAEFDNCKAEFSGRDLFRIDSDYMYLCLFATRGTVVTFEITDFKIGSVSQLA